MSILDDFINKKGKSAVREGLALLGKQKKRGRKANIFQGIGLAMKLKNYLHGQDVLSNLTEFEETSKAPRASLLAEWQKQARIHAKDEDLKSRYGDDLSFYFKQQARENWKTISGFDAPEHTDKEGWNNYQSWVTSEAQRLTNNHEAKLKGATLGKLSQEEATAEFDRVVRATLKAGISPSNINWFRGVVDNALGKDNKMSPNLNVISSRLKDLAAGDINTESSTITSGDIEVNVRQGEGTYNPENYRPEPKEINISSIVSDMYTAYPFLSINTTRSDIASEINKLVERNPYITEAKIQNILLNKTYANKIAQNKTSEIVENKIIDNHRENPSIMENLIGKRNRQLKLNEINSAYIARRNANPNNFNLQDQHERFREKYKTELAAMPAASSASADDKTNVLEYFQMIQSGYKTYEGSELIAQYLTDMNTVERQEEYQAYIGMIANKVKTFAFKNPSIGRNINDIEVFQELTDLILLKDMGALLNNGNPTSPVLNDYYNTRFLKGTITADEYLEKTSEIYNAAENDEEKASIHNDAYKAIMRSEKYTEDEKVERVEALNKLVTDPTLKAIIEVNRSEGGDNNIITNVEKKIIEKRLNPKDTNDLYSQILDVPVVGNIADALFGQEFGTIDDFIMFIPGFGIGAWGIKTVGGYAIKKGAPILAKKVTQKLLSNPQTLKLIEKMRLKITKGNIYKNEKALEKYLKTLNDFEKAIFNSLGKTKGNLAPNQLLTNILKIKGARIGTWVSKNKELLWYGGSWGLAETIRLSSESENK